MSAVIQCVGFLKGLYRVLQVVVYVGTVHVISDLTRRLQLDEITTHHLFHIDGGSRTMWACCK